MTVVKIVFVVLLCIPVVCVSFFLFERLLDEYIKVNKYDKKQSGKVEHIEKYRQRKRRYH